MKKLFGNMDLYKGMILGCLLLIPAAGAWVWWLKNRLEVAEKAAAQARKPLGDLQMIGLLQKQIERQAKQAQQVTGTDHYRTYMQGKLVQGGLRIDDAQVQNPLPRTVGSLRAIDKEFEVLFGRERERLPLTRDYINVAIYNIESQLPIYKLRELKLVNRIILDQNLRRGDTPPPSELPDEWYVEKMVFASREPMGREPAR
jgi:hypothetical protein